MRKTDYLIIILLILQMNSSVASESLEKELSFFIENKFKTKKYEDINLNDIDYVDEFNPDTVTVPENINIDYNKINKTENHFLISEFPKTVENKELLKLEKKYEELKVNTNKNEKKLYYLENDIISFANTIPLLKTKHAEIIQTKIKNTNQFMIKFLKPDGSTVSYKQLATLSLPEDKSKNIKLINDLTSKIKTFNKINSEIEFVTNEKTYIPFVFIK
jgi:ribosomal protein S17